MTLTAVLAALLDGIAFSFGVVLVVDGGVWQQPTGAALLALSVAYVVFVLLALADLLATVILDRPETVRDRH